MAGLKKKNSHTKHPITYNSTFNTFSVSSTRSPPPEISDNIELPAILTIARGLQTGRRG